MGEGEDRLNLRTIGIISLGLSEYLKSAEFVGTGGRGRPPLLKNLQKSDAASCLDKPNCACHPERSEGSSRRRIRARMDKLFALLDPSPTAQDDNTKEQALLQICICYDSRHNSQDFAIHAAKVFEKQGIKAYLSDTSAPTPYLSFMTRHLKCDAGVMITASHNPKEWNGYKVYNSEGYQLTDEESRVLSGFIDRAGSVNADGRITTCRGELCSPVVVIQSAVRSAKPRDHMVMKGDSSADEGLGMTSGYACPYETINLSNEYLTAVKNSVSRFFLKPSLQNLKITFTPLCGAGGIFIQKILGDYSANLNIVHEQFHPNGDFPNLPQPDPSYDNVYTLAKSYAQKNDSDLIIAADPDADRMGVCVRDVSSRDGYTKLSGNEAAVLMVDYLLSRAGDSSVALGMTGQSKAVIPSATEEFSIPTIIRSIVSTNLADKIAKKHNAKVVQVLTGFKYIGEKMNKLSNDFLIGFEESCGYLIGNHARDKDAVEASLLISLIAGEYKKNGKTLLDRLNEIYEEYGYHLHETVSLKLDKKITIQKFMDGYRNDGKEKQDYLAGIGDLPKTDMLEYNEGGTRIIIRPSGTEPLVRFYFTAIGDRINTRQAFEKFLRKLNKKK